MQKQADKRYSSIDVTSMPDLYNSDNEFQIIDRMDDSMVLLSHLVFLLRRQLLTAGRPEGCC